MTRILLVINATLDAIVEQAIAAGRYPRKDYLELQRALDADILDRNALERRGWTRLTRRLFGLAPSQALLAWRLASHYNVIFVDQESSGIVLAVLLRLRRQRPRLVMIGHFLSPRPKQAIFRALCLAHSIDTLIVHASLQQRLAVRTLGFPREQVALLPYQTDVRFWGPPSQGSANEAEMAGTARICSAGLEYRDYPTLLAAVEGLEVKLTIAAASRWSTHQGLGDRPLPSNVQVVSLEYLALRDLYARSRFVVIPLLDVENQAGITTILEAMAMGKAVIVSHTRGQTDVVRDRRRVSRWDAGRPTQPSWARALGVDPEVADAPTGFYVRPGDAAELRRAIAYLLAHPEVARTLGENGRRLVEEAMSIDLFTARIAALLSGARGVATRADLSRNAEAPAPTGAKPVAGRSVRKEDRDG